MLSFLNFTRKKIDIILSKYTEKSDYLLKNLTNQLDQEDTNSKDSFKIIENYFEFCNHPIIDEKKLAELKNEQSNQINESNASEGQFSILFYFF